MTEFDLHYNIERALVDVDFDIHGEDLLAYCRAVHARLKQLLPESQVECKVDRGEIVASAWQLRLHSEVRVPLP